MPWGPYFSQLPVTGSPAKALVDQVSWDALIDNSANWKGPVNGGGYTLSNVVINAGITSKTGSAALTFPTINDESSAVLTFTLNGAIAGDQVLPGMPPTLEAGLIGMMRVSAPNTIEVRLANFSGGPITPAAAQVFGVTVALGVPPTSGVLTFPAINDLATASLTFSAPGVLAGAYLAPGFPVTLEPGLIGMMFCPADGVVQVRLLNVSGGTITPAPSQTFKATNISSGIVPAGLGPNSIETPAGSINGTNAAFTVSITPALAGSSGTLHTISLTKNGSKMIETADFTISGTAITFVSAAIPQTGDVLEAWIWK